MRLGQLILLYKGEVVRTVDFRKGLNLIVDKSDRRIATDSGNSVGKTTVLRAIKFCLGGDANRFWKDPDKPGQESERVKSFINSGDYVFRLSLLTDDKTHWIQRKTGSAGRSIDGVSMSVKEFN